MMDDLISAEELAKRWGVTERTLRAYRNEGQTPQFMVIGKNTIRYRIKDVIAFENRKLKGGMIPERVEESIRKAAEIFDVITKWNLRKDTTETIENIRDELRGFIKIGAKESDEQ